MLLCDFHREQAWDRWLTKVANGCSDRKGDILPLLRRIAHSKSIEHMNKAIADLKDSEFWKKEKLQNYITKYWLPLVEVRIIIHAN